MAEHRSTDAQPGILVVDPSKVSLISARKLLEPHFGVYLAESGDAAWDLVESVPEIAAVFAEQGGAGLDNNSLLRRIRAAKDARIAELPVIVITSSERTEAMRRAAFEAGATDFVLKPFDTVDLVTRARAWSGTTLRAASLQSNNSLLRSLVLLDADTRAGNKDYFLQELVKDRSFCQRHQGDHSLLHVSIDGLERIRHEQGRVAANEAIALVADAVRAKCRREDTFARVDDAAFALSLLQTPQLGARVLAERIRQAIGLKVFKPRGMTVSVTVSIGVTTPPIDQHLGAEALLQAAERASRQAAKAGGNQTLVVAESSKPAGAAPVPAAAPPPRNAAVAGATPVLPNLSVAAIREDPSGFIEELLPFLQHLDEASRLTLIDRLLVMTETPVA